MVHVIRLAVIGLVGYLAYDIISRLIRRNRHPVAALDHSPDVGQPMLSGASHRGKVVAVHDSDGSDRRRTVGRGVVS